MNLLRRTTTPTSKKLEATEEAYRFKKVPASLPFYQKEIVMKRFTLVLALVLALGFGGTALAGGHGKHSGGYGGGHDGPQISRYHAPPMHHGYHRPPVVIHGHRPPVVHVYRPPVVQVYYPPVYGYDYYYYGYRSPRAEMAVGIGQIIGAAIEMGR